MIAIKGMTMPKSCGDCPMFCEGFVHIFCGVTEISLWDIDTYKERHENCPLIELDRRLEHEINVYQDERK